MPIDHPSEKTLGIELRGDTLYLAALSFKKNKVEIDTLQTVDVKQQDNTVLQDLVKNYQVVSSIDDSLLIRQLELPIVKESAIETALPLQLEAILPYPIEEAVIERLTISKSDRETLLNAVAVKKEALERYLLSQQELGIDPEVISITPLALALYTHYIKASKEPLFTLYLGKKIHLIASLEGVLLSSFTTDDPKEIKKGILAIKKKLPHAFSETLFTIAPQDKDSRLAQIEHVELAKDPAFALSIGLALSALPNQSGINLRKGEFIYKYPFKRLKKTLSLYFASIALLSASVFFFGSSYLDYRQDQLKMAFAESLYQKVDQEKEITNLTLDELQQEILKWQKTVQMTPNLYALHPNIPRVSDVIAWLSNHPNVEGKLELLSVNYSMVKRPELARKDEKYQAKLELEFTTDTPRLAREFHDALIVPNDFVDAKSEIKWSTSRGSYKTSFYLKDKTFYP